MSRKPPRFDGFFDDAVKHIPLDNEVPIQERLLDDKRIRDGEEFFEVTTIPWDELDIRSLGKPQFEDEPWGTELNPDDRRLLDGACRKIGFEIIAFYKSKRQESRGLFPGTWGIYYFKQGLKRVQEQINTVFPSRSTESAALTVNSLPVISIAPINGVCLDASSIALNQASPVGGTYTGTGVSGATFNPASAGAGMHSVNYKYTDANDI